ncbi:hypothetical protein OG871_38470 [Kitasatospora sp. NBC_00374]|uniref:hypothetical protein n=1 Tax=Kitasatospora sp. NBC_00374 TaxID=2975964 RepID=UPI0030E19637
MGAAANGHATVSSVNDNSRYVAFTSTADNLVSGDTNGRSDVFLKDLLDGTVTLVSADQTGRIGNGASAVTSPQSISGDGRYVVFSSVASNLVPGDTTGRTDVFRKDMQTGAVTRMSRSASGQAANADSVLPTISRDGNLVAFTSTADNLTSGDANARADVFVRNVSAGTVALVSRTAGGGPANGDALHSAFSGDGGFLAFDSTATNIVTGASGVLAVYRVNLSDRSVTSVSASSAGVLASRDSTEPALSNDGRYVVFRSFASNLVAGDTNATSDVFRKDLTTGAVVRVSENGTAEPDGPVGYLPVISGSGDVVSFDSDATNLLPGFSGTHVYRKVISTGSLRAVSVNAAGTPGNNVSSAPSMTRSGSTVTFMSYADNLVAGDTNNRSDVFITRTP